MYFELELSGLNSRKGCFHFDCLISSLSEAVNCA